MSKDNNILKILRYFCLLFVIVFGLMAIIGSNGGGGDGGGDSCAGGPVPCLTEDWGDTYYIFEDQENGDPIVVVSNGVASAGGGIYYDDFGDWHIFSLGGSVIDCYNSELTIGAIDWDDNGELEEDEWLDSVEGKVNICKKILRVYDLVVEGEPIDDIVATYIGSGV